MSLLEISDLSVDFGSPAQPLKAVSRADLSIGPGEIVGIAGESGSGKTTLCGAMIGSLPPAARISGRVLFRGASLYDLSPRELRRLRGREITMILQNPMTSLDPLFTIGDQLREILVTKGGVRRDGIRSRSIDLLRSVHLTAPAERLRQYPHELSGGMRQRILIAMASVLAPRLLLADEPTTALDATVQEEILVLFREIRDAHGTAIVIVTHDLGVIRRICDRVVIMYAGRIVEEGPVEAIFNRPRHPYTRALLASVPRIEGGRVTLQPIPGQVPSLAEVGESCTFADRCPLVRDHCRRDLPPPVAVDAGHRAFCFETGALQ